MATGGRILELPAVGRLLFCTDLHGNLRDFERIAALFESQVGAFGSAAQLLFAGDLIHGPSFSTEEWPEYLGTFYLDRSAEVLSSFVELAQRYPGQVHSLLGNHEHSHIGGPHTPKFWLDETTHFEEQVGPAAAQRFQALFRSFPLVACAPCGVVFTHAAPNALLRHRDELDGVSYAGHEGMSFHSIDAMPLVGRLLWARRCADEVCEAFLAAFADGHGTPSAVVFGHDIAPEGYQRFGERQLMLSTSFGLDDEQKRYLSLDLSHRYANAHELRQGVEILPLYG